MGSPDLIALAGYSALMHHSHHGPVLSSNSPWLRTYEFQFSARPSVLRRCSHRACASSATYVVAATLMILKTVSMSWLTVVRMMQVKAGFRSPEDLRKNPFDPEPNPKQLEPNEYVERIRRIRLNDPADVCR